MSLQRITNSILFASVALLASACDLDEKSNGDPVAEQGDGDGDNDNGDNHSELPNGDGDGDNGDGDNGDGDNGDGDGEVPAGDPDPAIVDACTTLCELSETCDMTVPDCFDTCINAHLVHGGDAECVSIELNLTECLAGLDCEELTQFADEDAASYPCETELDALCEPSLGECTVGAGVGLNPGECSVDISCAGEPERSVECDGEVCTCFVDNVEVGGCADTLGVCGDPGEATLDACCG